MGSLAPQSQPFHPGCERAEGINPTCRFFLQTLTAAKASCICFLRASLWRLYAISMKIRKIPAAIPPATNMKTPVGKGQTNRNRAEGEICELLVYNLAAPTEHECIVCPSCSVVALLFQPAPTDGGSCNPHNINGRPQPHKVTAQYTVRHTSTEHPRRH